MKAARAPVQPRQVDRESRRHFLRLVGLGGATVAAGLALSGKVRAPASDHTEISDTYLWTGRTSDPVLQQGLEWYRSDLLRKRWSPDGVGTKDFAHTDDAPGAHNLLSTSHGDTLAAAALRGALVLGNSTPAWARLAHPGLANRVPKSSALDVAWGQVDYSELTGSHNILSAAHDATVAAAAAGDIVRRNTGNTAWERLAAGATDTYLKILAGVPAWVGPAYALASFQVLTSGTTYTTPAGVKAILVEAIGGGGGGGGCTGVASSVAAGGGGGGGSYGRRFIANPAASYTIAIGAAGAAGSSAGGNGGAGGSTTFAQGTTLTCPGGSGGIGQTAGTTLAVTAGGAGGVLSTGQALDVLSGGAPGEGGIRLSSTVGKSGLGGSSNKGGGGGELTTEGVGNAGKNYGGGGGGALTTLGTARAGGAGAAGVIIVWEFK